MNKEISFEQWCVGYDRPYDAYWIADLLLKMVQRDIELQQELDVPKIVRSKGY